MSRLYTPLACSMLATLLFAPDVAVRAEMRVLVPELVDVAEKR